MEILQRFPVGFGFSPTDQEFVEFYLYNKILGKFNPPHALPVIDLYAHEPREIWQKFGGIDGQDLHFFTTLKKNKSRVLRRVASNAGTWSAENSPIPLFFKSNSKIKIGSFKRFHYVNTRDSTRPTDFSWIMFEYVLDPSILPPTANRRLDPQSFVACKIRKKIIKKEKHRAAIAFSSHTTEFHNKLHFQNNLQHADSSPATTNGVQVASSISPKHINFEECMDEELLIDQFWRDDVELANMQQIFDFDLRNK